MILFSHTIETLRTAACGESLSCGFCTPLAWSSGNGRLYGLRTAKSHGKGVPHDQWWIYTQSTLSRSSVAIKSLRSLVDRSSCLPCFRLRSRVVSHWSGVPRSSLTGNICLTRMISFRLYLLYSRILDKRGNAPSSRRSLRRSSVFDRLARILSNV